MFVLLSGLTGFAAVMISAKHFCSTGQERVGAVFVYAASFFAVIYAPIAAIWANAPFYAWVFSQKTRPPLQVCSPHFVSAVERTLASYYLGLVAVLMAWASYAACALANLRAKRKPEARSENSTGKTGCSAHWLLQPDYVSWLAIPQLG